MDGWSLCKSVCVPIWLRPSPQEIVLGRLDGAIRRLFGEIAVIRAEKRGFYRTFFYSLTSAISPRSVRIPEFSKLNSWDPLANDFLRERITHIGEQSDLHKLYPSPIPL